MLLAVDIGNTSTKCGIYDGEDLRTRFSFPTNSDPNEIRSIVDSLDASIDEAIICSVVPDAADALTGFLNKQGIKVSRAASELNFGFIINYSPISSLGTDRLVNALAALHNFGSPAIVCSFGTATTIDAIDKDRGFLGGIIAPGMRTAAGSLKLGTSQLPDVTVERPARLLGNSTEACIRSGIVFGHAAMVEGLIERFTREVGGKPVVVATGGFASLLDEMTDRFDHVDQNLTLDGLRILHERLAQT